MSSIPGINDNSVKRGIELRLDTAVDGVDTSFPPSVQSVVVQGVAYTQTDLKKKLLDMVAPWQAARTQHAALRQFSQSKPTLTKAAQEFLADLHAAMAAQYGNSSETLTHFGFKPAKRRRSLTIEEKAIRAAKAKLTREKRGTKGKRQKEALKQTQAPDVNIPGAGGSLQIETPGSSVPPAPPAAPGTPTTH
jgi:hypothetical protein